MSSARHDLSARQLELEIGVSYKTALRMVHRIREVLEADDIAASSDGRRELAET